MNNGSATLVTDNLVTTAIRYGKDNEFLPDKVHSIANPYVPPYPREPRE